jgi:hypothetical protein
MTAVPTSGTPHNANNYNQKTLGGADGEEWGHNDSASTASQYITVGVVAGNTCASVTSSMLARKVAAFGPVKCNV